MKYLYGFALLAIISACTYSITLVHTQGQAKDVVDETATTKTEISPNVEVPATNL